MKCLNCGRRITQTTDIQLCNVCSACETMYDAIVARLKRQLFLIGRSFLAYMSIAAVIYFTELFSAAKTVGLVLLYFALASSLFSAAQCLSQYFQLRQQRKSEEQTSPK